MLLAETGRLPGHKALILGLLLAALMAASLTLTTKPAHAEETFTVTRADDLPDLTPGDNSCDVTTQLAGPQCNLRAAIQEANATEGTDTIDFDISCCGVKSIRPSSPLPEITERVTIDGYTQTGAFSNTLTQPGRTNAAPKIELDGSDAGSSADGLVVRSDAAGSVIKGLVINRFGDDGIASFGAGIRIEGNFIGTDPTGEQDLGNGDRGVTAIGGGSIIGGAAPEARSLISGNGGNGVAVALADLNTVEGNLIGTKKDGASDLGNTGDGVFISNSSTNRVGGFSPEAANTIAFNDSEGVEVSGSATSNLILGNSIFSNGRLGIDLRGGTENASGATANDTKDPDTGPNNLQNKPVLTSAKIVGGKTTVQGKLNSTSRDPFVIEFFANPSGNEGKKFIGNKAVSTDSNGNASFSFTPSQVVPAGQTITATATNVVTGDTSEFSTPKTVTAP